MMHNITIKISGKVQGVFFRASTKEKADSLGLKGWVRNEPDGDVLVEAEGDEQAIQTFIEWCHHGPRLARVDQVDIHDGELKNLTGFIIVR